MERLLKKLDVNTLSSAEYKQAALWNRAVRDIAHHMERLDSETVRYISRRNGISGDQLSVIAIAVVDKLLQKGHNASSAAILEEYISPKKLEELVRLSDE